MSLSKDAIYINVLTLFNTDLKRKDVQYHKEEVQYWTEKIYNTNISFNAAKLLIAASYVNSNTITINSNTRNYSTYIAQSFFINPTTYPNGIFLESIDLFFAQKDTSNIPITLQLRPLVNGVPDSFNTVKGSEVTLSANNVTIANNIMVSNTTLPIANLSAINSSVYGTNFKFKAPVYITNGYYCFTLSTNSDKYVVTHQGKNLPAINVNATSKVDQTINGAFFSSKQGVTWSEDQTQNLNYLIYKAKFVTGTKTLTLRTRTSVESYDDYEIFHDIQTKINPVLKSSSSFVESITATLTDASSLISDTIQIKDKVLFHNKAPATSANGINFNIALTNTDENLSPIIDADQCGVSLITNDIDAYSSLVSESETTNNGLAYAKYVTKKIILNEDFDADSITVFVDVCRPAGTRIEVFYKILNKFDFSTDFSSMLWDLLPAKSSNLEITDEFTYVEDTYEKLNMIYTDPYDITYTNFRYFAIKIVMYSESKVSVPKLKNLRVIATV